MVTKQYYTIFFAGALLDFRAHHRTDPTQTRLAGLGVHSGSHERAILFARAFRNDNDCKFLSEVLAFLDFGANAFVGSQESKSHPRRLPRRRKGQSSRRNAP